MAGGCGVSALWRHASWRGLAWLVARGLAVLTLVGLGGCSSYIFRTFDIDRNDSLSIDARQRAVIVTRNGGKSRDRTVVCAEPSPDAITARAATLSGSLGADTGSYDAKASFAAATSEMAGSIAMRTQTIQLIRDSLYRACEGYMNGAIDQYQYTMILTNIDRVMVTLLGVDAIGGTALVPGVVVGAGTNKGQPGITGASPGPVNGVQAEAITNVLLSANSQSTMASMCLSVLASGELRADNPGQSAVLERCDRLLDGTVRRLLSQPAQSAPVYRMSIPPPADTFSSLAPAAIARAKAQGQSLEEGWSASVKAEPGATATRGSGAEISLGETIHWVASGPESWTVTVSKSAE